MKTEQTGIAYVSAVGRLLILESGDNERHDLTKVETSPVKVFKVSCSFRTWQLVCDLMDEGKNGDAWAEMLERGKVS